MSWDRTRWVNVLLLLLYRDAGELGWDQGVGVVILLVLILYRDAGESGGTRGCNVLFFLL